MATKFLDSNGLLYLWSKIKDAMPKASTTTPKANGTAAVGTETTWAKGDHVHPSDTTKVDKVSGKGLSTNDFTTTLKNKLDGIAASAEVNQNAFSNIVVGTVTVAADQKTDSLTLVAGNNVSITPDATNDKITIAATDTTYSAATTSAAGLMSATDKAKLDGIAEQANKYSLPTASADTLGGIKVGTNLSINAGVLSATDTTYSAATQSAAGLMSADDKKKLDGIGANANQYTLPDATTSVKGGVIVGTNISVSSGTISVANASTSAKGVVQLSSATNSTSTTLAATASAVKSAYDLANGKQSPATTLAGYGITDAYTKTQVDGLVSGALHYKGTSATLAALVATVTNKTYTPATGDVWNITTAGGNGDDGTAVKAGDNVAYNGTGWDVLGGTTDLSSYALYTDVIPNTDIDTIVAS